MGGETRWVRLERYARWKQNRVRLDKLPSDVLTIVCRFLPNESVHNLLAALQGHSTTHAIASAHDVVGIPIEVRRKWLRRMAYEHVECQLKSLMAHTCLYCSDMSLQVHAFADWSMFQSPRRRVRRPIAEYHYGPANGRLEWKMRLNERVLRDHVDSLCDRMCCATRISLYQVFTGGKIVYLIPHEVSAFLFLVFPHFLVTHV